MKMLTRLAWRNLGRNWRRTALMVAVVALATWAIVVLWGITEGFHQTMVDAQVRMDTGDLQVHADGYLEQRDLSVALTPSQLTGIRNHVSEMASVKAASARIVLNGLLKSAYGSTGVAIRGVQLPHETRVTQIEEAIVDGRVLQAEHEIVLGRSLARDLDVRLGERVVLEAQGREGRHSRALRLVGVMDTGLPTLDERTAIVPLADARALSDLEGAMTVAIALSPGGSSEGVAAAIENGLSDDLGASTVFDLNPLIGTIAKIGTFEMMPTMLILSLLAGFGVANTVMFTVLERTREFGIMAAIGFKARRIALLILTESTLASLLGFAIGGAVGYGSVAFLSTQGIDLGFYADRFASIGVPSTLYAETSGWYWLYGLSVVILTALVAAWYPARRVSKLEPTEAIRDV